MNLLMNPSQINGLPVVTLRGGEDVAEVRDVIYSPQAGRLVGLTLNKRGFFSGRRREVLPADGIHAIGRNAVMIVDESSSPLPRTLPTTSAIRRSSATSSATTYSRRAGGAWAPCATSPSS